MTDATARRTLAIACLVVIATGIYVAAAAHPATAAAVRPLAGLVLAAPADLSAPETRLLAAIAGGLMVGWGILLALLVRERGLAARAAILASTGGWFAVDGLASLAAGAPLNVGANLVFLALFWVPLLAARPARAPGA